MTDDLGEWLAILRAHGVTAEELVCTCRVINDALPTAEEAADNLTGNLAALYAAKPARD